MGNGSLRSHFDEAWQMYPRRPGDSKPKARKAWNARIKAGVAPGVMLDGVRRYAAYVAAEGTEPKFIKQAATFFGPDEHYLSDYTTEAPSRMIQTYAENGIDFSPEFLKAIGAKAPR